MSDGWLDVPFSTVIDRVLAQVRELEARYPALEKFDEATLPSRTFEFRSPEERAWVFASNDIIRVHVVTCMAQINGRAKRLEEDAKLTALARILRPGVGIA